MKAYCFSKQYLELMKGRSCEAHLGQNRPSFACIPEHDARISSGQLRPKYIEPQVETHLQEPA